jgi:voltage-gated potassium channel
LTVRDASMMTNASTMTDYSTPRYASWDRWTSGPLLVIAIGSLPLLLLELARHELPNSDRTFLLIVNWLVLVAFAVDYIVKFVLATNRRSFVRHEWATAVIVLAQVVALLAPTLWAAGSLRALRGARAWRAVAVVFRVVAIGGFSAREGRAILLRHAARFALSFAALTALCAAVGFTLAEPVGDGQHVHSFFDALWWAASTMTTVGCDVFPVTAVGRLIGVVTMLAGIAAASIITAKVASFLVRVAREEAVADAADRPELVQEPIVTIVTTPGAVVTVTWDGSPI